MITVKLPQLNVRDQCPLKFVHRTTNIVTYAMLKLLLMYLVIIKFLVNFTKKRMMHNFQKLGNSLFYSKKHVRSILFEHISCETLHEKLQTYSTN